MADFHSMCTDPELLLFNDGYLPMTWDFGQSIVFSLLEHKIKYFNSQFHSEKPAGETIRTI